MSFSLERILENSAPLIKGERFTIPPPSLDWEKRLQRRMCFRNERNLYHRECSLTGKKVVSFHSKDNGYSIIDQATWWGDSWDPLDYGRDFDFGKTFFEQFAELQLLVPKMSMVISRCENCDYGPYSIDSKNCYMAMSCDTSEDLYYCFQVHKSRDCVDCLVCKECELCYQCIDCFGLFDSQHCQNCENSNGLYFCKDLHGCTDCIGCKNLVRKNYILNKPASPEQVAELKQKLQSRKNREIFAKKVEQAFSKLPHRATRIINCENSTGDFLMNCKNCEMCFYCSEQEDCGYILFCPSPNKDCSDLVYSPYSELVYDSMSAVSDYNCAFLSHSWNNKNSYYCFESFYSSHLFGCIGLKKQEYCILNKKYSEEDYFALVGKIINHMRETKEWGEFFPSSLSPYCYNESIANDFYPLSKEDAGELGCRWKKESKQAEPNELFEIPDTISETDESICSHTLYCQQSKKNYRIIKPELALYQQMKVPAPSISPDMRYRLRFNKRNKPKLHKRSSAKSEMEIFTSYSPDRSEPVYSEEEFREILF